MFVAGFVLFCIVCSIKVATRSLQSQTPLYPPVLLSAFRSWAAWQEMFLYRKEANKANTNSFPRIPPFPCFPASQLLLFPFKKSRACACLHRRATEVEKRIVSGLRQGFAGVGLPTLQMLVRCSPFFPECSLAHRPVLDERKETARPTKEGLFVVSMRASASSCSRVRATLNPCRAL